MKRKGIKPKEKLRESSYVSGVPGGTSCSLYIALTDNIVKNL